MSSEWKTEDCNALNNALKGDEGDSHETLGEKGVVKTVSCRFGLIGLCVRLKVEAPVRLCSFGEIKNSHSVLVHIAS